MIYETIVYCLFSLKNVDLLNSARMGIIVLNEQHDTFTYTFELKNEIEDKSNLTIVSKR